MESVLYRELAPFYSLLDPPTATASESHAQSRVRTRPRRHAHVAARSHVRRRARARLDHVHDAEGHLRAAAQTALEHTEKGGVAVFAPDVYRETLDEGDRGLRCLEWMRDPDPNDGTFTVDYAFLLREGANVRAASSRATRE